VEIVFTKLHGGRHEILVRDREGPDVRRPSYETGPTIPHDLAHAAVESALGFTDGYCGAFAAGATFEGFEAVMPERHRHRELKILRRLGPMTERAERAVSWALRVWSGQRTTNGNGPPSSSCPLDEPSLQIALRALDEARMQWDRLGEGESLVWKWQG
jgi:hypothetical protein